MKLGFREWTYNSINDVKFFPSSDMFRGTRNHGFTFWRQIWWKTAVENLPKSHFVLPAKKTRLCETWPSLPFCPRLADRTQNFLKVVVLWPVHVYQIWSGSLKVCRSYSRKIDFWHFQPTNIELAFPEAKVPTMEQSLPGSFKFRL